MDQFKYILCLSFFLLLCCGGPGEIRQWQPDFSGLDAYDWGEWDEKPLALAEFQKAYPSLDSLMKSSLREELIARGYKLDSQKPDFLVYYYFTVEEMTTVRDRYSRYGAVGRMPEFRKYEEGRLIIDFVRIGSMEMIWSGDAGDVIEESIAPEQRRARIKSLIKKVFQQVPQVR